MRCVFVSPCLARLRTFASSPFTSYSPAQHVDFFDADGDGIIWPIDTYIGFRRIGFGRAFSLLAAVLVNGSMSFATWPNWIPRVGFPIFVERFHRTKHGSDAGVFDGEGRFSGPAFEAIFSKHATAKDESGLPALSREDIRCALRAPSGGGRLVAGRLGLGGGLGSGSIQCILQLI